MSWFAPKPFPSTSYGYRPPPDATAHGWACTSWECRASTHVADVGFSARDVAKRWPLACRECGSPADPLFDEPWAHEAEGLEIQAVLRERPGADGGFYVGKWEQWQLKDAYLRGERAAAAAVHRAVLERVAAQAETDPSAIPGYDLFGVVWEATAAGDLDPAARCLLVWFGLSRTEDVENHNGNRTNARQFISMAMRFFDAPGGHAHPQADEIRRGCLTIAAAAFPVLLADQQAAVQTMARE